MCSQAGSQYHLALLWTVTVGVLGIVIFIDTAGRIAITSGRAMFDVILERLGFRLGMVSLVAAMVVNTLTLVIEICGMALVIQLLTHLSYIWWVPIAGLLIAVVLWFSSFNLIPSEVSLPAYAFMAISLLGAFMTPYEIFFYSSGAIEEKWGGSDFITNRVTGIVGFSFGSLIVIAMMVVSAQTFFPHGLQSQSFTTIPVPIISSLGEVGFLVFLLGAFVATGGAALETSLSTAYTVCQFVGWDWGQEHNPKDAPVFTFIYLVAIVLAVVIAVTGLDPIKLTIYTTALAAFSLPFTFFPLFIIANDRQYMGEQRNGLLANIGGLFFLVILCIVTLATIPLFILSGGGGGHVSFP